MTNLQPSLSISREEAAKTLQRRRAARRSMVDFVPYVIPEYQMLWYHKTLCEHLDAFVRRDIENLMVFMPPQHGKSQLVSRSLPAFIFGVNPDAKVIAASYAAELIQGMNRDVQRIMESDEYKRLFPGTRLNSKNIRTVAGSFLRNNDIFEIIERRGQYRCAGVGGGLTGFPCDFGLIDDPIKDYREAASETVRNAVWEWYLSVFLTRTHKHTGKLLTQTRWHEDDPAGRLLELEPNRWTVLKLPALCEDANAPNERRQVGEALWPERFPAEMLLERKALNPAQFEALYQQNPTPREGAMFKVGNIEIVDAVPANLRQVRAWDIGATAGGGDASAGMRMGREGDRGIFYITDYVSGNWSSDERNRMMLQTAELDGVDVRILVPQDPGAAGKSLAETFVRMLAGFSVRSHVVSGSKENRADPFSAQVNAGNVKMLRAPWNRDVIEQLRQFPNGKHDEAVDTGADCFNEIAHGSGSSGRMSYDTRLR